MDWDLIALDEMIERNRTERLDNAMEELCGYTPGRGKFRNENPEPVRKKRTKKNRKK